LPSAKHLALTAATALSPQSVVAQLAQHLHQVLCFLAMGTSGCNIRINIFSGAAVIRLRRSHGGRAAGGYRCVRKQAKASLEQATRAISFRGVGGNFRAALWAKSDCAGHYRRVARALPSFTA